MRIRKSWVAVGTAAVLGAGTTATAATALNDTADDTALISSDGGAVSLAANDVDPSPESPDSPNASVVESADSPFDNPTDAGYVELSPLDSAGSAASADSPVQAPVRRTAPQSAASADSPAPAPVRHRAPVQSADSPSSAAGPVADRPAGSRTSTSRVSPARSPVSTQPATRPAPRRAVPVQPAPPGVVAPASADSAVSADSPASADSPDY